MKDYSKSNWDGLTGIISVLFGLSYGSYAYLLPRPIFGNEWEPIIMPLSISVFMIVIGLLLIVNGRFSPSITAIMKTIDEHSKNKINTYRVLSTCLISLLYSFMFEPVGFVISTIFFMLMMLMVTCGIKRWKQSLVIGVVFSVGIYFIFNELLSINLPSGTLFS